NTSAFDWASRCAGAHVVGWESVTVPAGTFRALHVTTEDGGEVWASREVPFGLVKTHGKQGDLGLTGRGADAKSSITEKPLEMPALPMPKDCGYETQRGRRRSALAGFGLSVLTWVTLFHTLPEAEPCVRPLVDPRRRHVAHLPGSLRSRSRLRLHRVRRPQVAGDRDLPRRAQRCRRGLRVPGR